MLLALTLPLITGAGTASAQTEPYILFEAAHYGHDQGNWNVGLWRYFGDGTQIPYRITTPCGEFYPGGPVNQGGAGRVYWGTSGADTHSFTLTYDPTARQLDFEAIGLNTISETAFSPCMTPLAYCDPPDTLVLYDGTVAGGANNLLMAITATAGTTVSTCGPDASGCKSQEVRSSSTEISNLTLDGQSVTGGLLVNADLNDNPASERFTNSAEVNISVPDNQTWILAGEITIIVDTDDPNFVPMQSNVGMSVLGQYLAPAQSGWDTAQEAAASVYGTRAAEKSGLLNNILLFLLPLGVILVMRSLY